MDELTFDSIERKQLPVSIAGKKYVLMEADGAAGTAYQNALMSATRMDKSGSKITIDGMANAEPLLLSRCLYYADDSGRVRMGKDGQPEPKYLVSLKTIQGWPNRIQTALFNKLQEISDLNVGKGGGKGVTVEPDEETLNQEIEERQNQLDVLRGLREIIPNEDEEREGREKN